VTIIAPIISAIDDFVVTHQSPFMAAVIVAIIKVSSVIPIASAVFISFGVFCTPAMGRRPGRRIGVHRQSRNKGRGDHREG